MNIIDVVKSGKRIRRKIASPYWLESLDELTREDILATDWEIEERKIEITEAEFDEATQTNEWGVDGEEALRALKKRLFAVRSGE